MYALKSNGRLVAMTAADDIAFASGSLLQRVCCAEQGTVLLSPKNPYLDYIALRKSEITIERAGEQLFRGQAVGRREKDRGYVEFSLLGDLSYLRDEDLAPFDYTGSAANLVSQVLSSYNALVESGRQIAAGTISKTGLGTSMSVNSTGWRSAWDILNGLYQTYGGLLRLRTADSGRRVLDWLDDSGHFSTQPIIYGDNLRSLLVERNATEIVNCIAATAEVNGGQISTQVEDAASIAQFGRVRRHRHYQAGNTSDLAALARADLSGMSSEALRISGKAVDKWAKGFEPFRVGDFAQTVDPTSRIDTWIMISELKHDLTGSSTQVTLGSMPQSLDRTERSGYINAWIVSRQGRTP